MITCLLQELEGLGCAVTPEKAGFEPKLKLHNVVVLTSVHREQLKKHKRDILEMFDQQERARGAGWIVYPFGEAYEKRIGFNSWVYLFREDNGSFTVWRGTWKDKSSADKEKLVIEKVDFKKAFEKANSYVNWFSKK